MRDDEKPPPEDDPHDSDESGVRDRDAGIDQRTGGAGSGDETPREPQAGL
jgi:hypothetical protein